MADRIINLKIDVSAIDKAKLFKGKKGTYLDCTLLFNETPDKYGNNGMIVQDTTKEERAAGNKGNILGNGKLAGTGQPRQAPAGEVIDDLPF